MEIEDIYYAFRKAQAESKNRGWRMPKDFDKHLNNKMSIKNKEVLELVTKWFNTKWRNIDPTRFMECGFELFKTFSYIKFFDERIINLYKQKDKNIKRVNKLSKEKIKNSMLFVKKYIDDNNISSVSRYCMMKKGYINVITEHYLNNYIDKFFMIWLIKMKLLKLDDDNLSLVPYISDHYREVVVQLDDIGVFLNKLKVHLE